MPAIGRERRRDVFVYQKKIYFDRIKVYFANGIYYMARQINSTKKNGRIFTPEFVVSNILDFVGYRGPSILKQNIMDNSCGDGAFLKEIVARYCAEALKKHYSLELLKSDLAKFIYGLELDPVQCAICAQNLEYVANQYGVFQVKWNIRCTDSLDVANYNNKMDYVVGNPPYVRVHNISNLQKIKQLTFTKSGMVDLYIAFFEIGLKMLKNTGKLCYITPSSYFTSVAGKTMREYFVKNNLLTKVIDLKHSQVFDATTYNAITLLSKQKNDKKIDYFEYDLSNKNYFFVEELAPEEFFINHKFYFGPKEKLKSLRSIILHTPIFNHHTIEVKNGFATLYDNFFIQDSFPFEDYIIPILKSSTGKWKKCFFPYKNGQLIPLKTLEKNKLIKQYYEQNKDNLTSRDINSKDFWWGFGRTQGLKDINKIKYSINSLVKTIKDIKLIPCKEGEGTYSGLYILTDLNLAQLKQILISQNFIDYISMLGKYKNGGCYTFSSKDLKAFLEYSVLKIQEQKYA